MLDNQTLSRIRAQQQLPSSMSPWATWTTTFHQRSSQLKPFYEKSSLFSWPGIWEEGEVWWRPEMERWGWRQTWPNLLCLQEGGEVGSESDETIPLI